MSKTKPNAFRLGINKGWVNRWFFRPELKFFLEEDDKIRNFIKDKISSAGIDLIKIDRTGSGNEIKLCITASRPGIIIGRGGRGVEDLKNNLKNKMIKLRRKNEKTVDFSINLTIEELRRTEISASVTAHQIAFDLKKRMSYRRVIKRTLATLIQNRNIKGAKIQVSGRLNGAEMARSVFVNHGNMPLQTIRANIDFGEATAFTTYGTVGVKVWLYKGEIFEKDEEKNKTL